MKNNIKQDRPDDFKVPMKFDISMLNMFIGYIFKKNSSNITRKSLSLMHQLFGYIDERVYSNDPQLDARITFINNALDAIIVKGFENDDIILNYCRSDTNDKYNADIIANIPRYTKINYEEIKFINNCVEDRLRHLYILTYKDQIYHTLEKLDSGDFRSYEEINTELINTCTCLINKSRSAKTFDTRNVISLSDENFDNSFMDIVNNSRNPKRILHTGIRRLNELLSPGLIGGRTYIFLGTPGGFKSGMLLKIARDIKKYNKGVDAKPGKRPTVLLLTMENSVDETVERLFNMVVSNEDIRNFTPTQALKRLKETGEFKIEDINDVDIVIRYEANRSITTDDIYSMIDDMADAGQDVIALVFDYIKRIRPAERGKDEKEELKNITNELKTLATHYDIPVISAHQMNRDAAATVDAAMQANKADLAKFLGRSNVGSAWEVIENSDWVCILQLEKKRDTGQYFLTFKRVKIRYKNVSDNGFFHHPFELDNRMKLIDDINLAESLSEESLECNFDAATLPNMKGRQNAKEREDITDTTIFDFGNRMNKKG